MQAQTIKAYLYQQYGDDDDVRAFFTALNAGTQAYVDWFNQVNLAYYPGLTGDLLDWVANGLYGMQRPQLEQQGAPPGGPLNTEQLNTEPLNTFIPPIAATVYALSDDIFQRILTWNLYKADGKYFCMRWIKRRIMRFLVGANGIDPDPSKPGFVVGPEDTSAISVQVSSGTLTVTITQARLAAIAPFVTTQTLTLFQLIFLSGVLELPARYQYACTLA